MPQLNNKRIIILIALVTLIVIGYVSSTFFLSSSTQITEAPQKLTSTKTPTKNTKNVKCQKGLEVPAIDTQACAFKEVAAAEMERRKICEKTDAKEALDVACSGSKLVSAIFTPLKSQPTAATIAAAPKSKCSPSVLLKSERFNSNKTLACGAFQDRAANEFFKDPRPGCKTKEDALEVVKRTCAGDTSDTPVGEPEVATATPAPNSTNPLANLVNCDSIAALSAESAKTQPTVCSAADIVPKEFGACVKEIVALITPICLGLPQSKGTTLAGVTSNLPTGEVAASLSGECSVAAKVIEVDTKACQFKDLTAQELLNRNLCLKESAKTALDKMCSTSPATAAQAAGGAPVVCSGAIVAKDAKFQANKALACAAGKSIAIEEIMERPNSPCKTQAEAAKALAEACNGGGSSAGQQPAPAAAVGSGVEDQKELLSQKQLPESETQTGTTTDPGGTGSTAQSAGDTSLICNGAIVAKDAKFQANKALACAAGKSIAIQEIMKRPKSPCKTEAEAAQALDEACNGGGTGSSAGAQNGSLNCAEIADNLAGILQNNRNLCATNKGVPTEYASCSKEILDKITPICVGSTEGSGGSPASAECTAVASTFYKTVSANTSLCNSQIPDQYKSCTETIISTLKPICSSASSQNPSTAKCDGPTVASDAQFQQSKELACGAGKTVATTVIAERADSPCKGNPTAAAKALDEACKIVAGGGSGGPATPTTAPGGSSSNLVCNGALVSKNADFIANKALACSDFKNIAIQKILSTPGTPCKDEAAARKALDEACQGTSTNPVSTPTATSTSVATPKPTSSSAQNPSASTTKPVATSRCTCQAIAANAEFKQNSAAACGNQSIAADQIVSKSNGSCTKTEALAALDSICSNQCNSSGGGEEEEEETGGGAGNGAATGIQTPEGVVPFYKIGTNEGVSPGGNSKCTCTAIAANAEFQQNRTAACANRDIAAGQIAEKSGGSCSVSAAKTALGQICDNSCNGDTANVDLVQVAPPKTTAAAGGAGGTSKCTCANIAANPEFQQNSGLACQFKSQAVDKIVAGSNGNCDAGAASAELDKICSNQCVDASGQAVQVNSSGGGGGFMGMMMGMMKNIPIIGDLIGGMGGGGGGGGGGGFDLGGIIEEVKEHIGGFLGGFF